MKRRIVSLLLALVLVLGLFPTAHAAYDSKGRYALNQNDFTHAYVVKGDVLSVEFSYNTQDAPCASPVWLYKADLTGNETQEELDDLARKLLKGSKKPLYFDEGWTHSLSSNRQSQDLETADLKTGTYLIVAAAMSDYRYIKDGGTTKTHYDTATGVALHVVEKAVPIETYEYWYCDANGKELKKLTPGESFIISHENDSPLYHFKIKTYPANATERVTKLGASSSAEERYTSCTTIPGIDFENGLYSTCAQHCGKCYFWLTVDSFGEAEDPVYLHNGFTFEVPCHSNGPVKVQQWYTCTEPGYKCSYCYGYGSTCETVFGYEILPAPGHQLKQVYEVVNEPTATQPGLALGLCKNCLGSNVESAIPAIFSDTVPDAFYSLPLDFGYDAGWVTGTSDTTFTPNGQCQRAQIVTFLWRAAGCPVVEAENPFTDVKETDFYYDAVLWAVENGITTGTSSDTFSPFKTCSRAEVVTFLWRAHGKPGSNAANPFEDVKDTDFFHTAVLWAVENGITNGMDATHFGSLNVCNRAQVVTFLYRAKDVPVVDTPAVYSFELKTNDPTEEIGWAYCEGTAFAAGESVLFYAEPWFGYIADFEAEGELELYYLGACNYELIMPDHDVTLTVNFVPAQGDAHHIRTTCENGEFYALCDVDEDFNDIAKPGEFVQFYVMANEGFTLTPENITLTAGGESWEQWWFLGQVSAPDPELELGSIFAFEAVMPNADLDVSITCTAEGSAAAQAVRVPVSVK